MRSKGFEIFITGEHKSINAVAVHAALGVKRVTCSGDWKGKRIAHVRFVGPAPFRSICYSLLAL